MDLTQSTVSLVCSNNGAFLVHVITWLGGVVASFSVVANFRNKLPSWAIPTIDRLAFNFVKQVVAQTETPKQP